MKRKVVVFALLIMILANFSCFAKEVPESYMEISVSSDWGIFTKDMDDTELLSSVDKTKEEINEILASSGSESLIINKKNGMQIYLKVEKNDASYELWNISDSENDDITTRLKEIVYDAFNMGAFDYQDESVEVADYAYAKFITIPGTTYINEKAHGVIASGTVVNGKSVVFTMITKDKLPTDEEISAVGEIAQSVAFTVIKDRTNKTAGDEINEEKDVFNYLLGGFGALVLIIFCVYVMTRMKSTDKEETEKTDDEK